jgi:hypothetical protein
MVFLGPGGAWAETNVLPVEPGSQVRVSAPGLSKLPIEGSLAEVKDDSLTIVRGDQQVRVPREAIAEVEVRVPGHKTRAAWIGFAAGAVVGGVAGYGAGQTCTPGAWFCIPRSSTTPVGAVLFGALGAGVGALAGHDRWERVSHADVHVGLSPVPGRGVGLAFSARF